MLGSGSVLVSVFFKLWMMYIYKRYSTIIFEQLGPDRTVVEAGKSLQFFVGLTVFAQFFVVDGNILHLAAFLH